MAIPKRNARLAVHRGTTVTADPHGDLPAVASRVDNIASGELQAVQVDRPIMVHTRQGDRLARVGEWLVTDPDGTVRVLTDQKFRMQTLHQQLSQLLTRSRASRAS
ncbi:MAG: hypothetical protein AB7O62_04755 [Pirellulales bacterium]